MAVRAWFLWAAEAAIAVMFVAPQGVASMVAVGLLVATAILLLRAAPRTTLAAGLICLAALLGTGALSPYSVPVVAQAARAKDSIKDWQREQIARVSCNYRQLDALEAGGNAALDAADRQCAGLASGIAP